MDKFNSLPKLERALGYKLQKMCNTVHEVVRQLRALEYPLEGTHIFFVHGIHDRLDPETSQAWELTRTSENPTTAEILRFLDRQARALSGLRDIKPGENRKRNHQSEESED